MGKFMVAVGGNKRFAAEIHDKKIGPYKETVLEASHQRTSYLCA